MPNNILEQKPKKLWFIVVIVAIVLLLVISLLWWFVFRSKSPSNTNNGNTATTTNTNLSPNTNGTNAANTNGATAGQTDNLVARLTFSSAPANWVEEIWYQPKSAGGEVTYGTDGVTFTGIQSNSRSGIMTTIEKDVSAYSKLALHLVVANTKQTLTGTGWNGREAPVAVAISYLDASGAEHKLLGEDPAAAGQMFWRGFYTLDPTGQSKTTNGVKVTAGQNFTYDFDLMTLNPKPAKIHFIAVEGAGWKERVGTVHELSLIASSGAPIENVPSGVNAFLDQSIIYELGQNGFITYTGSNPPDLKGKYLVKAPTITYDKNNEWTGHTLDSYIYTFSKQTKSGTITMAADSQGANDTGTGTGGFISGKDNCFTVYVDLIGKQDTCDYDMPTLASGCLKNNTIEGWTYALLMKSHTDNETCNNEMTAVGNVRVIKQTDPVPEQ